VSLRGTLGSRSPSHLEGCTTEQQQSQETPPPPHTPHQVLTKAALWPQQRGASFPQTQVQFSSVLHCCFQVGQMAKTLPQHSETIKTVGFH
jgi:hypothetical protein